MKQIFLFTFCLLLLNSCNMDDDALKVDIENDVDAARAAFYYLNDIRENPAAFSSELGVDLSNVEPMSRLRWNEKLTEIAFDKAKSMAQNNYTHLTYPDGQVIDDKLREKGYEVFGSSWVYYGWNFSDGRKFMKKGAPSLVPMPACRGLHEDVGIAFVRTEGTKYRTYAVCIIADDEDKGSCNDHDSNSGGNSDDDDDDSDNDTDSNGGGNTDDDGNTDAGGGGNG